ncbi:MAG TPA: methyltransferase domain-containing protein [Phototrophicaceae bacterium]|nr:methyltransferase domain-containing protein [Phototrophicaceae bacterium]
MQIHKKILVKPPTVSTIGNPASWWLPARIDQPELLDLGQGSPGEIQTSLADLGRINRYLGGIEAVTRHLYPRIRTHTGNVSIADIGTGAADLPQNIAQWAKRQPHRPHLIGVDLSAHHLAVARSHTQNFAQINFVQADARELPFQRNSVDYVISSLFIHHLTPEQVVALLRQLFTIARCGLIISDLVRGCLPLWAFKLGQPIFAHSPITRYDGAVSIRRAYTPEEFLALAQAAGLAPVRVYRHWAWRMTLVVDK